VRGPDECWPWKKSRGDDGYGHVVVRDEAGKRHWPKANRIAFMLRHGYLPKNALHTCDHPWCENPKHLFDGTKGDNMRDMRLKRRAATGRRNGVWTHPGKRPVGNRNGSRTHPERLVRGTDHPQSKLTPSQVLEIVKLSKSVSQHQLARQFQTNQSTINAILQGRTWGQVTGIERRKRGITITTGVVSL